MFEKLLAVLPYSPGLSHQMAFYGRRMHEEASIRRTGLVFLVLAFMIQFFAVLSPPQSTVAQSSNDLIIGGIGNENTSLATARANAKQACESDKRGYMAIFHYYGISCGAIDTATEHHVGNVSQDGKPYYSLGQNSYFSDDVGVTIDGAGRLFWRPVSHWNTPTWHVLQLHNQDGKTFYIMYDCGNLLTVGVPPHSQYKPPQTPAPATPTPTPKPAPTTPKPPTPPPTSPPPTSPPPSAPPSSPPSPPEVCKYNANIPANSSLCYQPCIYNGSIATDNSACKPCDQSTSQTDSVACVTVHKTATNVTAGVIDANNTTANAGDVITYTLYAKNTGKAVIKDFIFQENLSDVLDYADVTDPHGGTLATDSVIAWPAENIAAGATASHQVTVKVKNPIPQTPASSSDPAHFDLVMTNVYGNAVNIKLPASPVKAVETVTTTQLPNTGPGTTLFIAAVIVMVAGYFYSRAGLLARESRLAIKEAVSA